MLLRMKIRINIVRCIDVNKIEITVLSARVLDALSVRGLKAKTVQEFERYGTRRIVKHCLDKGKILYSKATVQDFVWQERARMESGALPHYQWVLTRRAAVYLDQMAECGKIQDKPIRSWEAEHNPLFQNAPSSPSDSMRVSRSFYAEILALQGFPAGLRDSYFIRDNFDRENRRRAAGSRAWCRGRLFGHLQ